MIISTLAFFLIALVLFMLVFWGGVFFFFRKRRWKSLALSIVLVPVLFLVSGSFFPLVYSVKSCDEYQFGVLLFPKIKEGGWLYYGRVSYVENLSSETLYIYPVYYRQLISGVGEPEQVEDYFSPPHSLSRFSIDSIGYTFVDPPSERGGDYRSHETVYVMECLSRLQATN